MEEARARARRSDPATSHEAARDVELQGVAGSQRRACYDYVLLNPGMTAAEIAVKLGLERHVPSRRLPELRDAGLVENGPARICGVVGRPSLTWNPAKPAETRQGDLFR